MASIRDRVRNSILQITHNDAITGRAGGKIFSMSRSSVLECCLGCQSRLPFDRDGRHIEFSYNLSHSQRRGRRNSFCCIFPTMELQCAHCFGDVDKGKTNEGNYLGRNESTTSEFIPDAHMSGVFGSNPMSPILPAVTQVRSLRQHLGGGGRPMSF